MAGPGSNPELELLIDVKAKTGTVNYDEFIKLLVNGLERLNVPAVSIAPNVKLDPALTQQRIKKLLKEASDYAKTLSDTYKTDSSLGPGDPRLSQALKESSKAFSDALTLLSQKQLKKHFANLDRQVLAEAQANIAAGKPLTAKHEAVFKQFGEGIAVLEKQLAQLSGRLSRLSGGAANFPVDLGQSRLLEQHRQLEAMRERTAISLLRTQAAQLDAAQRLARYQDILNKGGAAGFANLTRTEREEAGILRSMLAAGRRRAGDVAGAAQINAQYAAAAGDTREYETAARAAATRAGIRALRQQMSPNMTLGQLPHEDRAFLMRGLSALAADYRSLGRDKLAARYEGEAVRLREEDAARKKAERDAATLARRNAERLARDQARSLDVGQRTQAAYIRFDPLLRQASTGGLSSLTPQQRGVLKQSLREFSGRLTATGQQSAIEYAARLTAVYEALAKAERDVAAANAARARQMQASAAAENASIARMAKIAQLEQQVAASAGRASFQDVSKLAKKYEQQIRYLDSAGRDDEAAALREKLHALRNPGAALEAQVRAAELARGQQVLANVGDIQGIGNVHPENARFVQAALEERRRSIGERMAAAPATGPVRDDLERQLRATDDAMQRLHTSTQRTNGVVAQFFRYAVGYGALWQALAAVKGLATGVTDLEKALTAIKAVSGATSVEMQSVSTAIFSVGKNSRYSMSEVTDAAKILAQAGVSADKMGSALKNVTNLASAIEAPISVVADLMTSMKEIFSSESDTSLANQLASAVNISKLTAEGLQTIIGLSGNVAESMNLTSQQYLAAVATLKNAGLKDSTVATGMRQLMLELQAPDDKLVKAFQERYAAIGEHMTASNVKDKLFEMFQGPGGLNKALVELERLGYNGAGRQTFSRAFDVRSQNALEALIRERSSLMGNEAKIGFSQASVIGSQQQMETLQARLTELKNSFIIFGDSVGKDALPPLMDFVETLSKAVQGLSDLNERMRAESGVGMGGIFGSAALGAGAGFLLTGGSIARRGVGALEGAGYGTAYGYAGMQADAAEGGAGEFISNAASYGLMAAQAYSLYADHRVRSASQQSNGAANPSGLSSALSLVGTLIQLFGSIFTPNLFSLLTRAVALLGGPFGVALAAVASLITVFSLQGKSAEEKAAQAKRQLESTNRLALEKAEAYRTQRDSVAELNVNDRTKAVGMGAKVIDVEEAYARVNDVIAGYVGDSADSVIAKMAAIGASGGVGALGNRGAVEALKKFEGLAHVTDAKLSELVGMASEAVAAPQALAESLERTYAQLKGMDQEKLNDGQKALIYAFEMTGRAREGFSKNAVEQLSQIRNLFRLAEQKSKELEGASGAAEEAKKALAASRDEMRKMFKRGDFMSMKTAVMEWAVALDSMGMSAVAYLRQEAAILKDREAKLRAKAAAALARKTGRRGAEGFDAARDAEAAGYTREADSLRDAATAVSGEEQARTYEASTANAGLRGSVTDYAQRLREASNYFSGSLQQFSASTGFSEAMALMAGGSPEEYAAMQSQALVDTMKKGFSPSARVGGNGEIIPGAGVDQVEKFLNIVETKIAQDTDAKRKRGETDASLARLRADTERDAKIRELELQISSSTRLGELNELLKPASGKKSVFDQLRAQAIADYRTEMETLGIKKEAVSDDPRTKAIENRYKFHSEKAILATKKHEEALAKIDSDEANKKRDRDLLDAEAQKKREEGLLKIEKERLDTLVASGAAAADVSAAIDSEEAAHRRVADAIAKVVYEQNKKVDGDKDALELGKQAADIYMEQNVSIEKQVAKLREAADVSAKLTDSAIARSKISVLGLTSGQYAYRKGMGYTESLAERKLQEQVELDKLIFLYGENRAKLADASRRVREAEKAGTKADLDRARLELQALNDSIDATETRIANIESYRERNTLKGMFEYSTGIGESGAKTNLANLANDQLANAWAEGGEKLRGGIVSSIDAIGEAFVRAKLNGESFRDAFKGIINGVAVDLASFFAKKAVWWFLMSFLGGFGGKGADIGTTSQLFSNDWSTAAARGGTLKFSGGGMIRGPGTGTSDSIPGLLVDGNRTRPLLLSNGESVLTARATRMLGADTITAINRGAVRAQSLRYQQAGTKVAQTTTTTQNNLEIHVPVNIESGAGQSDINAVVAQQLGEKVKMKVRETMIEEARPGGLLYRR